MPRGLGRVAVAAIGAMALALGLAALANGRWAGAGVALCGAALLLWSRRAVP